MLPMFLSSTTTSILDSSVFDFVVDGATQVIGIMLTPPLGTFISIALSLTVIGVGIRIMKAVRR